MLSDLYIKSFKCFKKLELELRPLTLLSGTNSGGKSSIIQAIVLLKQTLTEREWGKELLLAGNELALGSAADVLNQSERQSMELGISTASQRIVWTFQAEDRRALSVVLHCVEINGQEIPLTDHVRWLLPATHAETSDVVSALRRVSWITAERTGPRELLTLLDKQGHMHVGARGELAAGLLYWRGEDSVSSDLCCPNVPKTLFHQVRAWMQVFFPGSDLHVSPIDGASAVSLSLRSDIRSDFQRPQNVGFGLTQLFPIIVAVLAASEGDVILIENPEVHLHPKAQQDIGDLLAKAAAAGVQIVLETHSDHVLNGVRLAVKTKKISPDNVVVHFFTPDSDFVPLSPTLDTDGRLDSWPEGFFDQFDHALSQLM
ncbi:MAG: DUF3696 domain-containing protein [Candidatus Accumulibacter sp.]|jgi:predicted ATPase|nr:DUF3696 domain-containing protein [Accumulibacter sp.]